MTLDHDEEFDRQTGDFIERNLRRIRLDEGNYLVHVESVTLAESRGFTRDTFWWVLLEPLKAAHGSRTLEGCPCFAIVRGEEFRPKAGRRYYVQVTRKTSGRTGVQFYIYAWAPDPKG